LALHLPTMKVCAVVLNGELEIHYGTEWRPISGDQTIFHLPSSISHLSLAQRVKSKMENDKWEMTDDKF
jgi:hypothetical protein